MDGGLAKTPIQTASGTSGPTMKIEGIRNPEPLRDFLYERMCGVREEAGIPPGASPGDEALALLMEIRALRDPARAAEPSRGHAPELPPLDEASAPTVWRPEHLRALREIRDEIAALDR